MHLLNVSDKTISEWYEYLQNAQTRILLQIDMRIGGRGKTCVADETYIHRPPKNGKGRKKRWRNWLLVIAEKETTKFVCYLLGKRTRPAIETVVNEHVKVGATIKTDEHKAYYWLGETTSKKHGNIADLHFIFTKNAIIALDLKLMMAHILMRLRVKII